MKIIQSTWSRYHHFDLARELNQMAYLERIFTCLPWWKESMESREHSIPRNLIKCNFLFQGLRRVEKKILYIQTKQLTRWGGGQNSFPVGWHEIYRTAMHT